MHPGCEYEGVFGSQIGGPGVGPGVGFGVGSGVGFGAGAGSGPLPAVTVKTADAPEFTFAAALLASPSETVTV